MKLPGNIKRSSETAQSLVYRLKRELRKLQAGRNEGVATGFEKLDKITSGWQPSDLIIIAARPAMGNCICYLWHVIWQLIMECR
jgi:replicative DNA helicase